MITLAIGIDPGLAALGLAVIKRDSSQRWRAITARTIRTSAKAPLSSRLHAIWAALNEQIYALPDIAMRGGDDTVLAIEEQNRALEGRRLEGRTNADAVLVQQVVGVIRVVGWSHMIRTVEVSPVQAKRVLLGIKSTATKTQVQRAVRAVVSDCPKVMSEHASDAIANALAGARMVQ